MRNVSPPLEHLPQRPSCCRPLSGSARTVEKTVAGVPLAAEITAASHGSHHSGPDLLWQQRREAGGASPRCARVVLVRVKKARDLLLQLRRLARLSHGAGVLEELLLDGHRQIIPLQEHGPPRHCRIRSSPSDRGMGCDGPVRPVPTPGAPPSLSHLARALASGLLALAFRLFGVLPFIYAYGCLSACRHLGIGRHVASARAT